MSLLKWFYLIFLFRHFSGIIRGFYRLLAIGSICLLFAVLCLPFLQDFIYVETTSIIYKKVFHLHHRFVSNHIRDCLKVSAIFPDC